MFKKLQQSGTSPSSGLVTELCDKPLRVSQSLQLLMTILLVLPCSNGAIESDDEAVSPDSSSSPSRQQESRRPRQLQVTPGGTVRGGLCEDCPTETNQEKGRWLGPQSYIPQVQKAEKKSTTMCSRLAKFSTLFSNYS